MGRHFPVRKKSGNFEQTGKVREFQTNVIYYILVIFISMNCVLFPKIDKFFSLKNKNKIKILDKWENTCKVRDFFQSIKVGTVANQSRTLTNDELVIKRRKCVNR